MRNDQSSKMVYDRKPNRSKKRERPRKRWSENVEEDIMRERKGSF